MKQTKQFLRPLLMAIVMMVGMLVPQGAWAQITLITEQGDQIWCEDIYVALNTLRNESWMLGDGPVTMRFDSDIALSEELDCYSLGRDITIDLNDHVLTNTNDPWVEDVMSCIVYYRGCDFRITIQNGTIESNELNAICFHGISPDPNYQFVLKNVNVVTHQEGRHCLFDAYPYEWEEWGYDGDPVRAPKLQIIDSEFHSNGCSAISFTFQMNDEYVKSILPEGYSFYNANTDVELVEYADRPFVDENGNPATDIRTGVSQDLPKIKISDSDGYDYYCGNFKQAMDIYGFYGMTLTLLDDVKEGLCTTNYGMSVTIDLNGHTLDITHLSTFDGGNLNIIDSSEGKTGKLIVERFDVYTPAENNAVIEGNVKTWGNNRFTNNGLVEYVDGSFINNGDFITSWTWADDHSSATLRINHEDVDAVVTNEDTTPATCIASGVRTYTAAATYRDKNYADTKDEEIAIDPNAHSYTNNTLTAEPDANGLYAFVCDNGCGEHNDAHVIKDFNGEGNHLELTTDGEGNYSTSEDITLADANGFVSPVDFTANRVTYSRQMTNEWGTIVLPFAINYDADNTNYNLYQLTAATGENLTFTEYADGADIAAGTPMAVKAVGSKNDADKYVITLTAADNAVSAATITPTAAVNGLSMGGTYTALSDQTNVYFIAQNQFWWAEEAISIAPFRAWFEGNLPAGAGVKALNILVEEADGIANISNANGMLNGKYLENGRVVIVKNGKKFNLNGMEIK